MGLLLSRLALARLGGVKEDDGSTESDSALNKPLLAEESTAPFDPTCVLPKTDHHSETGRIHCRLEFRGKQVLFQLEHPNGDTKTLLTARRGKRWSSTRYIVAAGGADEPLATLTLLRSSMSELGYALKTHDGEAVAYVLYPVPGLAAALHQRPPRQAEVALLDAAAATIEDPTAPQTFREVYERRLCGPRSLMDPGTAPGSVLLRSTSPRLKANGRYGLSFAGRARRASRRNMRLVCASGPGQHNKGDDRGDNGGVVLQMAKWDRRVYNVDFCEPVTPLQAFGWALAQVDLN